MELWPNNWASWWYGFACGSVFTAVWGVAMLVYAIRATAEKIRLEYSSGDEANAPEPTINKPTLFLYESEQIPVCFR